ncbi:MAG: hypothetical protein GDA56_26060 [Hormoscilla sp. GM7CHS1pb]|nr:hypothetical protein [Hormoscilla sp. GM7CHS1pb]
MKYIPSIAFSHLPLLVSFLICTEWQPAIGLESPLGVYEVEEAASGRDGTQMAQTPEVEGSNSQNAEDDQEEETEAPVPVSGDLSDEEVIDIVITGTRSRRPVQTIPITIDVIDAEDIQKNVTQDIRDLVRYTPGISVRNSFRYGLQDLALHNYGMMGIVAEVLNLDYKPV